MLALKRREKIIGLVVAVVLVGVAGYEYVVDPYLASHEKVSADLKKALTNDKADSTLLKNRPVVEKNWKDLLGSGLKSDPAAAESQALHTVRDIAERTRVDLQSLKPDRGGRTGDFQLIRLQATGLGTTAAMAELLYQIETAKIPMKINDVRLTSRKEGSDDLSFALSVSTIVYAPLPEKITPVRNTPKKETP